MNSINNTLNVTLGDTPSFIFLGYDTCPNINRQDLTTLYNVDDPQALVRVRESRADMVRTNVRNEILSNRALQHAAANKKKRDRIININDRVLFKNHVRSNKLDLYWQGPGIVSQIDKNALTITIGKKVYPRIHRNHVILLQFPARQ